MGTGGIIFLCIISASFLKKKWHNGNNNKLDFLFKWPGSKLGQMIVFCSLGFIFMTFRFIRDKMIVTHNFPSEFPKYSVWSFCSQCLLKVTEKENSFSFLALKTVQNFFNYIEFSFTLSDLERFYTIQNFQSSVNGVSLE